MSTFTYVLVVAGAGAVLVVTATNLGILYRIPTGNPSAPAGCECSIPTTDIKNAKIVNWVFLGIAVLILLILLYRVFRRPIPAVVIPREPTEAQNEALAESAVAAQGL